MPDPNDPGRFGGRGGTERQARRGGQAGSGSFGQRNSADPRIAGRNGAQAQPTEATVRDGSRSHSEH